MYFFFTDAPFKIISVHSLSGWRMVAFMCIWCAGLCSGMCGCTWVWRAEVHLERPVSPFIVLHPIHPGSVFPLSPERTDLACLIRQLAPGGSCPCLPWAWIGLCGSISGIYVGTEDPNWTSCFCSKHDIHQAIVSVQYIFKHLLWV